MYNIDDFRKQCNELLQKAISDGNQRNIKKFQIIKDFLNDDNCFVGAKKISVDYVLENLGYSFEQILDIYEYFNKVEFFNGLLEYVNFDGELVQIETYVNPSIENYYKFDNGAIFKVNKLNDNFYYLINGEWVYDGELQKKIYDTGYDYTPIKCVVNKDSLKRL